MKTYLEQGKTGALWTDVRSRPVIHQPDLMPVLRPTEDGAGAWWLTVRRAPFAMWEVAAWDPWPSHASALALCHELHGQILGYRFPPTVLVERLYILRDLHPSEDVQLKAAIILHSIGNDDEADFGEDW